MDVAILFSGGKDSLTALELALEKGWNVKYLLSIKPNRTDCYLFHFATVEHTKLQAEILGIPHIIVPCTVADPKKEADIVKKVVEKNPVQAVILGGTGLQVTQIKSIQDALLPLNVETFASHAGQEHGDLLKQMIQKGHKIMISQFAAEGLDKSWLGRILDEEAVEELIALSDEFGFHDGGDGSAYDTFVVDSPLFKKKIDFNSLEKIEESEFSGYLIANRPELVEKSLQQHL